MTHTFSASPPTGITISESGYLRCPHAQPKAIFCCSRCRDLSPQILVHEATSIWATEQELAAYFPMFFSLERQAELLGTKEEAQRIIQELEVRLGVKK
jgi:hypothetical protein